MKIEDIDFTIPEQTVSENDFDIEKWRKESPMDYLKAMFLLNRATTWNIRNEVFKTIYAITRMYIPDVLYKYYSFTNDTALNEQKLNTLFQQKIFMSDAKYLNDPFDNKAYFYNPEQLKKYERLANHNGKIIDDFSAYSKITALTSNKINSMPMWAHYANNHGGYCVSYDMKSNVRLSGCTFPIQYTNKRIDITSLMDSQVKSMIQEIEKQSQDAKKNIEITDLSIIFLISLFGNLKHISWSYENEFRCTNGTTADGMPYISAKPKEIYVGMKCLPMYEAKLIDVAFRLQLPIYKMEFDELSADFSLIPRRLN